MNDLAAQAAEIRATIGTHKAAIREHRRQLQHSAARLAALERLAARLGMKLTIQGEGESHGRITPATEHHHASEG